MANSIAFRSIYDLAFQVSPIILVDGLATNIPGKKLPIIGLVGQLAAFGQAAASGVIDTEDFFARFTPIPGANVVSNTIGMYPFANQQVAANAIIEQPNNVSLMMTAPVKDAGGYLTKLATFTALQNSLKTHNSLGGTYHVATPSYIFTNCVMVSMTDVTSTVSKQQQIQWQIDFVRPLITQEQASLAQTSLSGLMKQMEGGQVSTSTATSGVNLASAVQAQSDSQGITGAAGTINNFLSSPL